MFVVSNSFDVTSITASTEYVFDFLDYLRMFQNNGYLLCSHLGEDQEWPWLGLRDANELGDFEDPS